MTQHLYPKVNQLLFVLFILCLTSCATHKIQDGNQTRTYKNIKQYFKKSTVLQDHLTGLTLYDLDQKAYVFNQNQDKYFTPASNTKIWTLFASLNTLSDSMTWMAVQKVDDRDVYFPMGDPTFLHPFMSENPRIDNYFKTAFNTGDTIYMNTDHFQDFRYGQGWMWDDQSYYFQVERSAFPIHANCVKLMPDGDDVSHEPVWTTILAGKEDVKSRYREEYQNVFVIPKEQDFPSYMPVVIDRDHYRSYFSSLGLHLEFVYDQFDEKLANIIYSRPMEEVYQFYMDQSDNLIAEQLLLQCSMEKLGYMNTADVIDELMKTEFQKWSDEWNWSDGSGISRYNLVTPHAMVTAVNAMIDQHGLEEIKNLMPKGGRGSMSKWYAYDRPRVFAKTGTVRYCHNLSGIIETKKGNTYTFSFMHNNFNYGSTKIKETMNEVMDIIVELY